jgi:hypothetical protein
MADHVVHGPKAGPLPEGFNQPATGATAAVAQRTWPLGEWPVIVLALGGVLTLGWAGVLIWLFASMAAAFF